jgi:hypothetical protein
MIAANKVAKKLRRHDTPEIKQLSWPPHVIDRSTKPEPAQPAATYRKDQQRKTNRVTERPD